MVNRKKRLKRGIESLNEQIKLHEEKRQQAFKENKIELVNYYNKEIDLKKRDKEEKERLLKKGG